MTNMGGPSCPLATPVAKSNDPHMNSATTSRRRLPIKYPILQLLLIIPPKNPSARKRSVLVPILSAIVTVLYVGGIVLVLLGTWRASRTETRLGSGKVRPAPSLAVVVAARNEEGPVQHLVTAMRAQSHRDFQMVVVDDRSEDDTFGAAMRAAGGDPRIRILSAERQPGIPPGKKAALIRGIEATSSQVLVFTDADCLPGPDWLKTLAEAYTEDTVLIAGYSPYRQDGLWTGLLAAEVASNAVMAAALIGLGKPVMCTARNLSYRRSAYQAAGGLRSVADTPSGDDTLMLQRIATLKQGRIRYLFEPASHVLTDGPETPRAFVRQKLRHFSTVPRYTLLSLAAALGFRSMDVLVVVLVPLSVVGIVGSAPLWAFLAKAVADLTSYWFGWGRLEERRLLRYFPLLELLHSPFITLGPIASLLRRVSWK